MPNDKFRTKRRRKRRFCGNQFRRTQGETSGQATISEHDSSSDEQDNRPITPHYGTPVGRNVIPSISKLGDIEESSSDEFEDVELEGYRFVDINILARAFSIMACPQCLQCSITVKEDGTKKMGFASCITIECESETCDFKNTFHTSPRIEKSQAFDVNRRVVLAGRNIGIGYNGLVKFSAIMNMPFPLQKKSHQAHVQAIRDAAKSAAVKSMSKAVAETKEFYDQSDNGICKIGVSGDGTWRRRGYKSLYGVVSVISIATGKVLDTEVMSKECRQCMKWEGKEKTAEYDAWWNEHCHNCQANFSGSSGAMDSEGTLQIFKRSMEKHSLIYSEFLGDGDSKAYDLLVEHQVYPSEIRKLECVGHIQKRMGSRLRELKRRSGKTHLEDGKTIGGKGRLTDKVIDSLQVYYGQAIRSNNSCVEEMKGAIMAIWNHIGSTDQDPQHELCPSGENSWCGYQKDLARGTKEYCHKHPLPKAICNTIRPIFEALSANKLLERCLHGNTQNANESLNALIWQRAPKELHSSLATVETATYLAVCQFNDGASSLCNVLEEQNIIGGIHCRATLHSIDRERINSAKRKSSDKAKKRRKYIRNKRKGYAEKLVEEEGPSYEAGMF